MLKKQSALPREAPRRAKGALGRLSPEYRAIVDATVGLLHQYKSRMQFATASTTEQILTTAYTTEQIWQFTNDLWADWQVIWSEAAECLVDIAGDGEHLQSAKEYTESQLTPELLDAPLWQQAYKKPLGYPGDYRVMDYIYDGTLLGDTSIAQVAHGLGILIGQFVVKRKDLVRQAISEVVTRRASSGRTVIANLGSGPAREIAEFLQSDSGRGGELTFILVDQDSGALRCAGRHISESTRAREDAPQAHIELRNLSVLRLLREVDPSELILEPDMIYSAGLFDYFSDRTCRVLSSRLYEALRPGGLLLLGNMKAGTDMMWPLEMIADWSLNYRTAENILTWAEDLKGAEISLRTEATGYDYLLSVRKPA